MDIKESIIHLFVNSFVGSSIWTVFYAVIHLKVKMLLIVDIKMYALVRG